MIVTQLTGGLGNQLFQYACGLALSKKIGVPLSFYFYSASGNTKRSLALDCFSISGKQLPSHQKFLFEYSSYIQKVSNHFLNAQLPVLPHVFTEKSFKYDPSIKLITDNTVLIGYWQSEKYFSKFSADIQNEFTFKQQLDKNNLSLLQQIMSTESVAIHIRRGDYVSHAAAAQFHGTLQLEYYQEAIEVIKAHRKNSVFYIFSDDQEWVKKNLLFKGKKYFVVGNTGTNAYKDLQLMSNCKNNIIANSSFSWWGAWLNSKNMKMIIAPSKWTKNDSMTTIDLIPKSWIQI
jgi:hypothetical protein